MTDLVVVADDLTGAMDTGHRFAECGHETSVVTTAVKEKPALDRRSSSVIAVNTDTRYVTPERAGAAVRRAVESLRATTVYKKVDSTLRGNVEAEIIAALDAADAELVFFAPAFPLAGRATVEGIHQVNGDPVTETEYGDDPNAPPTAALTACFDNYDGPVSHLDADTIDGGPKQVSSALDSIIAAHDEAPIVCCDAATDTALATIASAGEKYNGIYAGSGGLAAHVSVPVSPTAPTEMPTPNPGAPLAVVGSASSMTFTQLARLPAECIHKLDATEIVSDGWAPDLTTAVQRLSKGKPTVLTAATNDEDVQTALAAGRRHGQSPASVRNRIASRLAAATRTILETTRPSGLALTGGDIAGATLRTLDATMINLAGAAVGTGIPIGVIRDGDAAGLSIVTKPGGFGHSETLCECLDALTPVGFDK